MTTDPRVEFLNSEYGALRREQVSNSHQEYVVQRDFVVFFAAFYSFTETDLSGDQVSSWLYLIPPVVAFLSLMRQQRYTYWVMKRAAYCRRVEEAMLAPGPAGDGIAGLGWERFTEKVRKREAQETARDFLRETFMPDGRLRGNANVTRYSYMVAIVASLAVYLIKL